MTTVTVEFDTSQYARLESEAKRLGLSPSALAQQYVCAKLPNHETNVETERRRKVGLAALEQLDRIVAGLPPFDAVRVARESRQELENRTTPE
ncbi:MAG: hypothetical protein ACR2PL_24130 [Dehalococcoidia bacterium]